MNEDFFKSIHRDKNAKQNDVSGLHAALNHGSDDKTALLRISLKNT